MRRCMLVEEMGKTWLADRGSLAAASLSARSRPISRGSERPQPGAVRTFGSISQQTATAAVQTKKFSVDVMAPQ